ncbi:MAG: virion core protein, T7 gp14 family [Kiloniellales bacterium]
MCEPLLIASTASTVIGGVMQMQAQGQQATAQRQALDYQRQVAENNAITSERLAEDARERGREEERRQRMTTRDLKGRQTAVLAATGFQADTGSALGILGDTAELGELDALTIRDNAAREAWRFEVQAANDRAQAGLLDVQRSNVQGATIAPLLGAGGQVADTWYQYSLLD